MVIERVVPQHGAMFEGKAMVEQLLDWVTHIQGGVDTLLAKEVYRVPK